MSIPKLIIDLEKSSSFIEWKSTHPKAYLSSIFSMHASEVDEYWLVAYYNPNTSQITTFENCEIKGEEEAFTKEDHPNKLNIANVKIDFAQAIKTAKEVLGNKNPTKTIVILQNLNNIELWNITFITQDFKVINIRNSATDGMVIEQTTNSISDFIQQ